MMKKTALIFAALFCINLFSQIQISAQEASNVKWIRVHSDNAEFSIEVPEKYSYFYDENGFWTANNTNDYNLKKMNMLNAYLESTLLSFESYEVGKGGLEALYEQAKWHSRYSEKAETSDFERNGTKIKQIITKGKGYYCISQYFKSKSHLYILTAGSKDGDNAEIRHFLDSLVFNPETKEPPSANSTPFSKLKPSSVKLTEAKEEKKSKDDKTSAVLKIDDSSKLVILLKESPSYLNAARVKGVKGKIKLKVTFGQDGYIPEIAIVKMLPEGLLRQAIFTALRMKFIPQMQDGKPITVTKTVEYSFDIY